VNDSAPTFDISGFIWDQKYRYRKASQIIDVDISATWRRVAHALAAVEPSDPAVWEQMFFNVLEDFRFLPGGRILAGAGTDKEVTLYNCFVMGRIDDSLDGIFDALKEGALTMQYGGGVGYDFSTLRPHGVAAQRSGNVASGPVSFMHTWNSMCATMTSAGNRRGAMMACLRCDHPDIEAFVDAKRTGGVLEHFNLSVLITDAFMQAIEQDQQWSLVFPCVDGDTTEAPKVYRQVPARELWDRIMKAAYDTAEPGVLFIDQINKQNNLGYCEQIHATNPCGEIPLPYYGACNLGSVNLTQLVKYPFSDDASFDFEQLKVIVNTAVRMLDNVIDISRFPLPAQQRVARNTRRIGLGITGLADAFLMLGHRYGDGDSIMLADRILRTLCHTAYRTSVDLAKEKGAFPLFEREAYLASPFIRELPDEIREGIAQHGIRNSHLTAIAPAGTISLLAGNVSSGLEPVFDYQYQRNLVMGDANPGTVALEDYAYHRWHRHHDKDCLPDHFATATEISPQTHLEVQSVLQDYVDNAISKTINVPEDISFGDFKSLYTTAYKKRLKGCAAFRPNPVRGEILVSGRCCPAAREPE
jgi:ribonucleoside-diphosphate reductase alpha chain